METTVYWRHMKVPELIKYCQGNRQLAEICRDPQTWQYLLERDFGVTKPKRDPRRAYFKKVIRRVAKRYARNAREFASGFVRNDDIWSNFDFHHPNLKADVRDLRDAYVGLAYYSDALDVLGLRSPRTQLFGNKVGLNFVKTLQAWAKSGRSDIVTRLFREAGMY